jgi:hypothetical protein
MQNYKQQQVAAVDSSHHTSALQLDSAIIPWCAAFSTAAAWA